MTTAPEEEDRLTAFSHAQARQRTAQQTMTAELEEEDRLTVAPLAAHGLDDAPEEEGGDGQSLRKSGAEQCIQGSYLCAGAITPASAAAAAPAADYLQGTLTNDVEDCRPSLSDCSRQSHPASDHRKPQSPPEISFALAKQNSTTSYSMPTNSRLQHDSDGQRTDEEGAGATCQSSPESVHEPLLITSKRQVLPLSWSIACRRPGSPSMEQVSRGIFVIMLSHHHHHYYCCYCYRHYHFIIVIVTINDSMTITVIATTIPSLLLYFCCVCRDVAELWCDVVLLCASLLWHAFACL